jgi:hypothetical protein
MTTNTYTGSVPATFHIDGNIAAMRLLKDLSSPLTSSWTSGIGHGCCCGDNQCCADYVPQCEPDVIVGNEEDHVAVLENDNLSVRFYLDKKLSITQRVVYKLAGFKYAVNE